MPHPNSKNELDRRQFCKTVGATGIAVALSPIALNGQEAKEKKPEEKGKPATNIQDAMKHKRTEYSMPGRFPGKVVNVSHSECTVDGKPVQSASDEMLKAAILGLTGAKTIKEAWANFVTKTDRIGLKVNPVAGATLSTSVEIVRSVISQLMECGVPRENIVIWDRREFQLAEAGFTKENFPSIRLWGTECKDEKDSFYDEEGNLHSLKRIDKDWYYFADVEGEYNEDTMPYMVNGGKYSYFSKICTEDLDKIINIPILKNAGSSVTLCMKNLAYGAVSNTARLHKPLWAETCAEVCAFPPVRDKTVLNIVDGIKGCFDGGPGAKPEFITEYRRILVGSDPVAVDRIGYEVILKKRIEEGIQKNDIPKSRRFMDLSQDLGLGIADLEKIEQVEIEL